MAKPRVYTALMEVRFLLLLPLLGGVTGNTTDSESVIEGSNPSRAAASPFNSVDRVTVS